MARLSIRMGFMASCATALALAGMAASPAWSQTTANPAPSPQGLQPSDIELLRDSERFIDTTESLFAEAEARCVAGDCDNFRGAVAQLNLRIFGPENFSFPSEEDRVLYSLSPETVRGFERRSRELAFRPCPPGDGSAGSDAPATSIIDEAGLPIVGELGPTLPPTPTPLPLLSQPSVSQSDEDNTLD